MRTSAEISEDGLYRYTLSRVWDYRLPLDLWMMCNPSTADGRVNDNTINRCIWFSQQFGSGGFYVVNMYAFRTAHPTVLWLAQQNGEDIIGPENDICILYSLRATSGNVIAAWGAHPKESRVTAVRKLIKRSGKQTLCLGVTKSGQPRHPLMLAKTTPLQKWPVSA